MADMFYLGAYWGPRLESASECAQRLSLCLRRLGAVHPALEHWFRKGRSRSAASRLPVPISTDELELLLAAGRNRTDVGGQIIEELGFRLSLWNKDAAPVAFSTTCGAHPATDSVRNSFLLELPDPSVAGALYQPSVARAMFESVVQSWDPQWATFASYSMRAAQTARAGGPVGGWLTYISGTEVAVDPKPRGLSGEELAGGTLFVSGEGPLQVSESTLSAVVELVTSLC